MTDITTTPSLTVPTRPALFRLKLPRLGLGAFLAAAVVSIGEAFRLTYVAPYEHREALDRDRDW
jgi:hypothetical protein